MEEMEGREREEERERERERGREREGEREGYNKCHFKLVSKFRAKICLMDKKCCVKGLRSLSSTSQLVAFSDIILILSFIHIRSEISPHEQIMMTQS